MDSRAERRRAAFGIPAATESRAGRQRLALKVSAASLTAFAASLASGAIFPEVFSDARASAAASLSLWGVLPVMLGLMATKPPRSWKSWAITTLTVAAAWAAASGFSAIFIDDVFVGPPVNVFGAVFLVTLGPMVLFVVLVGIVMRMHRLSKR